APGGQTHHDGQDCRQCHEHADGFQAQVDVPAPHNLFDCAVCHVTPDTFVPNAAIPNSACQTCHTEGTLKTHFSEHIDPSTGLAANLNCVECHNPMSVQSNFRGVENRKFIRKLIRGTQVAFESTTGQYSFAYDLSDRPADMQTENYLCNTCHTQTNHHQADGTAPGGQTHHDGQDCRQCHEHADGFQAQADDCLSCHNQSPPAGSNDRNRRQIVEGTKGDGKGDFVRRSHHVTNNTRNQIVTNEDCKICHDQSSHTSFQDGVSVLLNDLDGGSSFKFNGRAASAESFCVNCHDGDNRKPFPSDNHDPPNIASNWNRSSHSKSRASSCLDCHAQGHGAALRNMLSNRIAGESVTNIEEGVCFTCHDANGPASSNIQAQFNRSTRHNISNADQSDGSKVECANCHNPHIASSANLLVDPDAGGDSKWRGSSTAFCLTCHDGRAPSGVSFPSRARGSGFDKSDFTGSTHDTKLGSDSCLQCHQPHGSSFTSILKAKYVTRDNNKFASGDYQACWSCHSEDYILNNKNNAFGKLHEKHVEKEDVPCVACHDTHGPFDRGEPGLINFNFALQHGFNLKLLNGKNLSTAFEIKGNKGSCYVDCHGKKHSPKTYTRFGGGGD
ncbi:MAG: cytochrome c3 family protein, partial [bacterium]